MYKLADLPCNMLLYSKELLRNMPSSQHVYTIQYVTIYLE